MKVREYKCQRCGCTVYSDFRYPVCFECKTKSNLEGSKMKCPFCENIEMEVVSHLGKGWYQCPNCGGTAQENPTKRRSGKLIRIERNPYDGNIKYAPSSDVMMEAERAREGEK